VEMSWEKSSSAAVGRCALCGKPTLLLSVRGRRMPLCLDCIPDVDAVIHPIAEQIRSAKAVKAREEKVKISPEKMKEKLVEIVESRGSASLRSLSTYYDMRLSEMVAIAQELARERGYILRRDQKRNVYLEKPAAPQQQPG